MREETRPRRSLDRGLLTDVGLEKNLPCTHASDSFQRALRMFQVVKHAIEKNQVDRSEPLGLQVVNTHQESCRVRLPRCLSDVESPHCSEYESMPITSRAPRLSASKEKKPSAHPMSKTRLFVRSS